MEAKFLGVLLLLLADLTGLEANDVSVTVQDVWQGRYHLKMAISATETINGWEVILQFSSPVAKMDVSCLVNMEYDVYIMK